MASKLERGLVRLSTAGSVDDGKSTLIGRLLLDTGSIYEDTIESIEKASLRLGSKERLSLALVTDGLKAEQEQGITIDVAYRYFSTEKRHFILADTPGHEQYTRNMATGASTANITIIVIDATKGVLPQTKRHSFIAALMGVPRLLIAVNKMDLVNYSKTVFEQIVADYSAFSSKLEVSEIRFVPISALTGENVVELGNNLSWYHGESVLEYLQNVYVEGDNNSVDFRFPVQTIIRKENSYRGYAGQIVSGSIHKGDQIVVLPSGQRSKVAKIDTFDAGEEGLTKAIAPQSVVLCLLDEIDIYRGDMIVRAKNVPQLQTEFEAMTVWMDNQPLDFNKQYIIQHTSAEAKLIARKVQYRIDINSLSRIDAAPLKLNEIGRVSFTSSKPLALENYLVNRSTGNFIVIDPDSFNTVAAGMFVDRHFIEQSSTDDKSDNLHHEDSLVSLSERESKSNWKARTIWLFGLSGSGKTTISKGVERALFDSGCPVMRLDGDTLRLGLNSNLGFSPSHRDENLRRAAEVAKLFNQAGFTVLCSFITPLESQRKQIAEIVGEERLSMIHINTPLSICEQRDPHGLYAKARSGQIGEFTGVSSPFENPIEVSLTIDTADSKVEAAIEKIVAFLIRDS